MKKEIKTDSRILLRFVLLVMLGYLITIALLMLSATIAKKCFGVELNFSNFTIIVIVSAVVGGVISYFITWALIKPVSKLSTALKSVADGNFNTRIETKSHFESVREMYENFNIMTETLESTETIQSDFVSNVSHEMKTPINAIEGYATLLQGCENKTPEEREYIEKIMFNTQRLSELVGNILLLSKVDNQVIQTNQSVFRVDEQIRRALLMLEPKWSEKNIDFTVELEEVEITGISNFLFHIWSNLIDNAVKFNKPNGEIIMTLKKDGDRIIFTIEDAGEGVAPEIADKIFGKFYQGDTSRKSQGNGLGLALVQKITELHGGEIKVEKSAALGGAKFTVLL